MHRSPKTFYAFALCLLAIFIISNFTAALSIKTHLLITGHPVTAFRAKIMTNNMAGNMKFYMILKIKALEMQ